MILTALLLAANSLFFSLIAVGFFSWLLYGRPEPNLWFFLMGPVHGAFAYIHYCQLETRMRRR